MKMNNKENKTVRSDIKRNESRDLNNREYISQLFASDNIKAPESLSEDVMLSKIEAFESKAGKAQAGSAENASAESARTRVRPRAVKWIALAACAVIAVFGIPAIYNSALFDPDTSVRGGELYTFKNENEINRIVKRLNSSSPSERFNLKDGVTDIAVEESSDFETNALGDSAAAPDTSAKAGAESFYSETYLQVEDVDEPDIVKVDGRYIYAVSNKREVIIYEAKDGKASKVSAIGNNGVEQYIQNIFLHGDTLVAVGSIYDDEDRSYIAVVSYDISDRSKPKIINTFRQSGDHVVSSRMVGDFVYLVTNIYAYDDCIIPKSTIDGEYKDLSPSDISCVPNPQSASYIILSAVDIASGTAGKSKTKAVMGVSDDIYCNNHNLYISVNEWDNAKDAASTRIVRASLDGLNIKFNGTAVVRGYIDNQFSMDEHNGYFRIATTTQRGGIDVNNLYVLDEKLNEVGRIAGFARDEQIKAVRFMRDKAYVITYEAIDPLFVMDLSDPENPRIEGEVKIDGFSSLLIPVDGTRLLGIGHATGDNGYGGQYASGLKLALFDISNPSEPKVLDSKEFKDMSSPAQESHLALTVNPERDYFAIPYDVYSYGGIIPIEDDMIIDAESSEDVESPEDAEPGIENEHGVLVFGIDKGIEVYDRHNLGETQILRSPCIGDYIYGIDGHAEVHSFRFGS